MMLARLRPHLPLLLAVAFAAALALAAMNGQNNLLFWMLGVVVALVAISLLLPALMVGGLAVRRLDPRHGVAGEPLLIRYAVTNRRRFLPAFNVIVEEVPSGSHATWRRCMERPRAWLLHVGPGETVHAEALVWPHRRGEARFDRLRWETRFPFGLARATRRASQPMHTLIYPRREPLRRRVLEAITPAGPIGTKLAARAGGGEDFFGVREYRVGDSRRSISWKRSAASEELVMIERTRPNPPRVRVVLHLATPLPRLARELGGEERALAREEEAIGLAASLLEAASHRGFEVGLSVLGIDAPVTPLREGHWHTEKMLATLAALDLRADPARRARRPRSDADAERAATIVIHPGAIDPSVARGAAWHFSAAQRPYLVEPTGPAGTAGSAGSAEGATAGDAERAAPDAATAKAEPGWSIPERFELVDAAEDASEADEAMEAAMEEFERAGLESDPGETTVLESPFADAPRDDSGSFPTPRREGRPSGEDPRGRPERGS